MGDMKSFGDLDDDEIAALDLDDLDTSAKAGPAAEAPDQGSSSTAKAEEEGPVGAASEAGKWEGTLRRWFGHQKLKPMQERVVAGVLRHGRDQLVVAATGSGKSLCYQFPPVAVEKTAVVISPLISLMEDQVLGLTTQGVPAAFLGSAQTNPGKVEMELRAGRIRLLYVTPEFVEGTKGRGIVRRLHDEGQLCLVAIDEAHCISQWGHDFRNAYRTLGRIRTELPRTPFMALTATATPPVRKDIIANLGLRDAQTTLTSFDRPNIFIQARRKSGNVEKDLGELVGDGKGKGQGSAIVYCPSRRETDEVCERLSELGVKVAPYHAGLSAAVRSATHRDFVQDRVAVVVATVAFGMGIDKPDVRHVLHYGAPKDLESYYQEMGRAGRDGAPAKATVLFAPSDFVFSKGLMGDLKDPKFLQHKMDMVDQLHRLLDGLSCRRRGLLAHFQPEEELNEAELPPLEQCCDRCAEGSAKAAEVDVGPDARLLLLCVDEACRNRVGLGKVVLVLRGSESDTIRWLHASAHPVFGAGKHRSEAWWKALGAALKTSGYLQDQAIPQSFGQAASRGRSSFGATVVALSGKGERWLDRAKAAVAGGKPAVLKIPPSAGLAEAEAKASKPSRPAKVEPGPRGPVVSCAKPGGSGPARVLPLEKVRTYQDAAELGLAEEEAAEEVEDSEECRTELFHLLEKVRGRVAEAEALAPYMVASNASLVAMAKLRPMRPEDFAGVPEFSEEKIRKFSQPFADAVRDFDAAHPRRAKPAAGASGGVLLERDLPGWVRQLMGHLNETGRRTYSLHLLSRLSLAEAAGLRSLKETSLSSHLATAASLGLPLRLGALGVGPALRASVLAAVRAPPIHGSVAALRPVLDAMGGEAVIDFARLKIVLNILEFEYGLSDVPDVQREAASQPAAAPEEAKPPLQPLPTQQTAVKRTLSQVQAEEFAPRAPLTKKAKTAGLAKKL